MQKKQNPRKSKYHSFTVSRDSFVDLEKLDSLDRPLVSVSRCSHPDSNYYKLSFPNPRSCPLDTVLNRIAKRTFDILLSVLVLVLLLSWIVPLLAILNRLRPGGPIFLLEKRLKRKEQVFTCIRFANQIPGGGMTIEPTGKMNRQINPILKFLKDHHMDELPLFINVFLGDMSVIGPRSYKEEDALHYEQLLSGYCRRYAVKPGISGLDPVYTLTEPKGNIQKMKDRIRLDLFYINHWSSSLDCRIMAQALLKMAGLDLNYSQNSLQRV